MASKIGSNSLSLSNYLKVMYDGLNNEVDSLSKNAQTLNQVGDTTANDIAVQQQARQFQTQNAIDSAQATIAGDQNQSDATWWERLTSTFQDVVYHINEGLFGFFDNIRDFAGDIARSANWIDDAAYQSYMDDDWTQPWLSGLTRLDDTFGFGMLKNMANGNMWNGDWWRQEWGGMMNMSPTNEEGAALRQADYDRMIADSYLNNGSDTSGFIYGMAESFGNMIPSIVLNFIPGVGQALSLAAMGVSAGSGKAHEIYTETGGDMGKALGAGAADAAIEVGTEILTKGLVLKPIGKLVGKISPVLGDVIGGGEGHIMGLSSKPGLSKTGASFIKDLANTMIEEGTEEVVGKFLEPVLVDTWTKGGDALKEYADSDFWVGSGDSVLSNGLSGALLGGLMGGVDITKNYATYGKKGMTVLQTAASLSDAMQTQIKTGTGSPNFNAATEDVAISTTALASAINDLNNNGTKLQIVNTFNALDNPKLLLESMYNDRLRDIDADAVNQYAESLNATAEGLEEIKKTEGLSQEDIRNRQKAYVATKAIGQQLAAQDFNVVFDEKIEAESTAEYDTATKTMRIRTDPVTAKVLASKVAHEIIEHGIGFDNLSHVQIAQAVSAIAEDKTRNSWFKMRWNGQNGLRQVYENDAIEQWKAANPGLSPEAMEKGLAEYKRSKAFQDYMNDEMVANYLEAMVATEGDSDKQFKRISGILSEDNVWHKILRWGKENFARTREVAESRGGNSFMRGKYDERIVNEIFSSIANMARYNVSTATSGDSLSARIIRKMYGAMGLPTMLGENASYWSMTPREWQEYSKNEEFYDRIFYAVRNDYVGTLNERINRALGKANPTKADYQDAAKALLGTAEFQLRTAHSLRESLDPKRRSADDVVRKPVAQDFSNESGFKKALKEYEQERQAYQRIEKNVRYSGPDVKARFVLTQGKEGLYVPALGIAKDMLVSTMYHLGYTDQVVLLSLSSSKDAYGSTRGAASGRTIVIDLSFDETNYNRLTHNGKKQLGSKSNALLSGEFAGTMFHEFVGHNFLEFYFTDKQVFNLSKIVKRSDPGFYQDVVAAYSTEAFEPPILKDGASAIYSTQRHIAFEVVNNYINKILLDPAGYMLAKKRGIDIVDSLLFDSENKESFQAFLDFFGKVYAWEDDNPYGKAVRGTAKLKTQFIETFAKYTHSAVKKAKLSKSTLAIFPTVLQKYISGLTGEIVPFTKSEQAVYERYSAVFTCLSEFYLRKIGQSGHRDAKNLEQKPIDFDTAFGMTYDAFGREMAKSLLDFGKGKTIDMDSLPWIDKEAGTIDFADVSGSKEQIDNLTAAFAKTLLTVRAYQNVRESLSKAFPKGEIGFDFYRIFEFNNLQTAIDPESVKTGVYVGKISPSKLKEFASCLSQSKKSLGGDYRYSLYEIDGAPALVVSNPSYGVAPFIFELSGPYTVSEYLASAFDSLENGGNNNDKASKIREEDGDGTGKGSTEGFRESEANIQRNSISDNGRLLDLEKVSPKDSASQASRKSKEIGNFERPFTPKRRSIDPDKARAQIANWQSEINAANSRIEAINDIREFFERDGLWGNIVNGAEGARSEIRSWVSNLPDHSDADYAAISSLANATTPSDIADWAMSLPDDYGTLEDFTDYLDDQIISARGDAAKRQNAIGDLKKQMKAGANAVREEPAKPASNEEPEAPKQEAKQAAEEAPKPVLNEEAKPKPAKAQTEASAITVLRAERDFFANEASYNAIKEGGEAAKREANKLIDALSSNPVLIASLGRSVNAALGKEGSATGVNEVAEYLTKLARSSKTQKSLLAKLDKLLPAKPAAQSETQKRKPSVKKPEPMETTAAVVPSGRSEASAEARHVEKPTESGQGKLRYDSLGDVTKADDLASALEAFSSNHHDAFRKDFKKGNFSDAANKLVERVQNEWNGASDSEKSKILFGLSLLFYDWKGKGIAEEGKQSFNTIADDTTSEAVLAFYSTARKKLDGGNLTALELYKTAVGSLRTAQSITGQDLNSEFGREGSASARESNLISQIKTANSALQDKPDAKPLPDGAYYSPEELYAELLEEHGEKWAKDNGVTVQKVKDALITIHDSILHLDEASSAEDSNASKGEFVSSGRREMAFIDGEEAEERMDFNLTEEQEKALFKLASQIKDPFVRRILLLHHGLEMDGSSNPNGTATFEEIAELLPGKEWTPKKVKQAYFQAMDELKMTPEERRFYDAQQRKAARLQRRREKAAARVAAIKDAKAKAAENFTQKIEKSLQERFTNRALSQSRIISKNAVTFHIDAKDATMIAGKNKNYNNPKNYRVSKAEAAVLTKGKISSREQAVQLASDLANVFFVKEVRLVSFDEASGTAKYSFKWQSATVTITTQVDANVRENVVTEHFSNTQASRSEIRDGVMPWESSQANDVKDAADERVGGTVLPYTEAEKAEKMILDGLQAFFEENGNGEIIDQSGRTLKGRRLAEDWNALKADHSRATIEKFVNDVLNSRVIERDGTKGLSVKEEMMFLYRYHSGEGVADQLYQQFYDNLVEGVNEYLRGKAVPSKATKAFEELQSALELAKEEKGKLKELLRTDARFSAMAKKVSKQIGEVFGNTGQYNDAKASKEAAQRLLGIFRMSVNGNLTMKGLKKLIDSKAQFFEAINQLDPTLNNNLFSDADVKELLGGKSLSQISALKEAITALFEELEKSYNDRASKHKHMSAEDISNIATLLGDVNSLATKYSKATMEATRQSMKADYEQVEQAVLKFGKAGPLKRWFVGKIAPFVSPKTLLAYMLGGTKSKTFQKVYNNLYLRPYIAQIAAATRFKQKLVDMGIGTLQTHWEDNLHDVVDAKGKARTIKRGQLYSFYLNNLSPDNRARMTGLNENRIVIRDQSGTDVDFSYSELSSKANSVLTDDEKTQLNNIFQFLNGYDLDANGAKQYGADGAVKRLADSLPQYLADYMERVFGFSNLREDYYFITANDAQRNADLTGSDSAAADSMRNALSNGHMKGLKNTATEIRLEANPVQAVFNYVDSVTTSVEIGEASRDWNRFFMLKAPGKWADGNAVDQDIKGRSIKEMISQFYPGVNEALSYMGSQLMNNRGYLSADSTFTRKMLARYSMMRLGFNLRSAVKQLGSLVTAWQNTGAKAGIISLLHGDYFKNFADGRKNFEARVTEASPVFRQRLADFGYVRGLTLGSLEGFTSQIGQKTSRMMMKLLEKVDKQVCYATFGMSQRYVQLNPEAAAEAYNAAHGTHYTAEEAKDINSEANFQIAADNFNEILLDTQSNSDRISMSMMRAGERGELPRVLFGMFASDAQNKLSLITQAGIDATWAKERGDAKGLSQARGQIATFVVGTLLSGLVAYGADKLWDFLLKKKDDDKEPGQKALDEFYEIFQNTVLDWMPYIGQFTDWVKYGSVSYMPIENLSDLTEALNELFEGGFTKNNIMTASKAIASYFGIPAQNVENLLTIVLNWAAPDMTVRYRTALYGASDSYLNDQMNEAIKSNDTRRGSAVVQAQLSLKKGINVSQGTAESLFYLKKAGVSYSVRGFPEEIDGAPITEEQKAAFMQVYSPLAENLGKMVSSTAYSSLTDAQKANAVTKLSNAYYQAAAASITGELPTNRLALLALYGVDISSLAAYASVVTGNSKKADAVKAVNSLRGLKRSQRLLILWVMGYSATEENETALASAMRQAGLTSRQARALA